MWSARKKITFEDVDHIPNGDLPPHDLATLGSKKIAPPESLRVFATLKARASNMLDRYGVRFMSGWAIPENLVVEVMSELEKIRDEFNTEKEKFLNEYDNLISDWVNKHTQWKEMIRKSTDSPEYVRARMNFTWKLYKVKSSFSRPNKKQQSIDTGLEIAVNNIGNTLFDEVVKIANETCQKVYEGKDSYSDFDLIKNEGLTDFEHFVWNCIEDWRIEQLMANHFSGCKVNLHWLIHHIFVKETKKRKSAKLDEIISEWLLLTVRSWDVDELDIQVKTLEKQIDKTCPQLFTELRAFLLEVENKCKTCEEALNYAKAIVACIDNYIKQVEQEKQQFQQDKQEKKALQIDDSNSCDSKPLDSKLAITSSSEKNDEIASTLQSLLDKNSELFPKSTGEITKGLIERGQSKSSENRIRVAIVGEKKVNDLDSKTIQHALRISAALKARLQGLLQAKNLVRTLPSSHGKINKNRLHGLAVQDTKIFLQKTKQQATNTAIHILLDTSGSMRGKIGIANQACYSLAKALENTRNINVGVTAFPAISFIVGSTPAGFRYAFLQPIVKNGEKVGNKFELQPEGGTPLTEALWWVFPQLLAQKEERKIILLITDGEPDNRDTAIHAIEYAKKIGIEIYGIGIPPCVVETLIPKSINLESIEQLPQAMFALLQTALVGKL